MSRSGFGSAAPFRAVLFDWRGTVFHDEDDAAWIRASAASIGQTLRTQEVSARVEMLEYREGGSTVCHLATMMTRCAASSAAATTALRTKS